MQHVDNHPQVDNLLSALRDYVVLPTNYLVCNPKADYTCEQLRAKVDHSPVGVEYSIHRASSKDPNTHISNFLEVCDTMKYNGVLYEAIRLRLFPFSLRDEA